MNFELGTKMVVSLLQTTV